VQEIDPKLMAEAYGKLKAGVKPVELVTELGIPYPKLLKMRKELKAAEDAGTIADLIDVQAIIVHEVAETVKQELSEIVQDPDEIKAIEGEISEAVKKIDNLQLLNTQVQTAAMKLTTRITELAGKENIDAREVATLTDALAKMQVAFFNKPNGPQVNILQQNQTDGPLGKFKELCSD
jgi:hypothetical protein